MRIANAEFELNIESGDAAFDTTEKATWEIVRLLKEVIGSLESGAPIEGLNDTLHSIDGNPVGSWGIGFEEMDWISDWEEWIDHCKEYIAEHGYYLEHHSTTVYDWDALAELDEDALSEWFNNFTDSAVTSEKVCPEARSWAWDGE